MKTLYYIMILVICLAPVAYSQVDTLEAIEVGTILAPSNITQLYTQDLNGDSLIEVILCTQNRVYIYNEADSLPFWTSPDLVRPSDLQFADIDGDSLLDVSVKDSANISIYNVFDSALIGSIAIDSQYRCYTIGGANTDNSPDILIVKQEAFDANTRPDSFWINLLYGPDFVNTNVYSDTLTNYNYRNDQFGLYDYVRQYTTRVMIKKLGTDGAEVSRICLSTNNYRDHTSSPQTLHSINDLGGLWLINPQNFQVIYSNRGLGRVEDLEPLNQAPGNQILAILSKHEMYNVYHDYRYTRSYGVLRLNESGLVDSGTVAYNRNTVNEVRNWTYAFGEMNSNFNGPEICYNFMDTLKEYSMLNVLRRWALYIPDSLASIVGIFTSTLLFPSPEIMVIGNNPTLQYLFINGVTHQINTILPNVIPTISNISDLNNDGNDEILSISGNTLHIYNLEWATPVAERPILPSEYLAVSNYPNPFNGQTIIKYNLPNQCDIALEIYDILGQKIESFEKPNQPAGLGQITWGASGEPSGVYFYRLSAGSEQKTGRMVLLK
jgi:hypothetical protein